MSDPAAPSVNSWLEDELYHQYLYDRQTVDSGWKQVFDADIHETEDRHIRGSHCKKVVRRNTGTFHRITTPSSSHTTSNARQFV